MLKKSMKIVSILLIIMMVIAVSSPVFATGFTDADGDGFIDYEPKPNDGTDASASVGKMADSILSVVQVVGMAVAVIMLIVLAIKYISAAPSDKAEIKKHAVVYVVGAVVLFAASGILEIVKQFSKNIGAA